MGVDFSKTSNRIFFAVLMPLIAYFLSLCFYQLFPDLPFWMITLSPLLTYGILYELFEKYAWHWKPFQALGVVNTPDLRGRWKGKQRSSRKENGKNVESPSYLEISQTFSRIFVRTLYEKSQSESVVANVLELNGEKCLFYTYENEPNSLKFGTMQEHKGTVKLRYLGCEKELTGTYFNSIGNHGEMDFQFEQDRLIGQFAE